MAQAFSTCSRCNGLSPASATACLHCDSRLPARWRRLASLLAGGGFLMTLAACYGVAYRDRPMYGSTDADHDGSPVPADCDDNDATRYPGAADPDLDGLDQNCDGVDGWRDDSVIAGPEPAHAVVE